MRFLYSSTLYFLLFALCFLFQHGYSFIHVDSKTLYHMYLNAFVVKSERLSPPLPGWLNSLYNNQPLLIIDGDNLRGKTKFTISKSQLVQDISQFLHNHQITCDTRIYFDHGLVYETIPVPHLHPRLTITFGGPQYSADDIISNEIALLQQEYPQYAESDFIVVTEDALLRKRCVQKSMNSRLAKKKYKKKILLQQQEYQSQHIDDSHQQQEQPLIMREKNWDEELFIISTPSFLSYLYQQHQTPPPPPPPPLLSSSIPVEAINDNDDAATALLLQAMHSQVHRITTYMKMVSLQNLLEMHTQKKGIARVKRDFKMIIERFQKYKKEIETLCQLEEGTLDVKDVSQMAAIATEIIEEARDVLPLRRLIYKPTEIEDNVERFILAELYRRELHQPLSQNTQLAVANDK